MTANRFVRLSLFLSLASGICLFLVMRACCAPQDVALYGVLALVVAIVIGVYKYHASTVMPADAVVDDTPVERHMTVVALFLPGVLAAFSALAIVLMHASIAKVGWTLFLCAQRCAAAYAEGCRHAEEAVR